MGEEINITVLVENSVNIGGLRAEHGLAFHIQTGGHQILFDTGQSDLLIQNARQLEIDLRKVGTVVLSHGHYDHTGGLKVVLELAPRSKLYLHPAAILPKFSRQPDGTGRAIGMSGENMKIVRDAGQSVVWTNSPTEVAEGVFVTGEIPRSNNFEDTGGRFFLDAAGTQPDPLTDDQAIYFDTREGLVVVLGCAHAGVVNTLDYIQSLHSGRPFRAVLGGLHLLNASPERLAATVKALRQRDIPLLVPAHCTGAAAVARLWESLPGRCAAPGVGRRFAFAV
jgi:7,8-dihydropterin-6-yl-methyl-4-(beta-D-ribofuranosyl)aminobenzene 5'-phosphate synthase